MTDGATTGSTTGPAMPDENAADLFLIAVPLFGPWLVAGFLLVVVLVDQRMTDAWAIAASAMVLLAPFAGLLLAKWRWRGRRGVSAVVPPLLLVLAIALTALPVTALFGLEATGSRASALGGIDTRVWLFTGISTAEIREPLVVATDLMTGLAILGWLARLRGSGSWLVLLWVVATLTGVVWLPLMGVVVLGQGMASHSPDSPAASVIRALPFVAHAVAPVLAVLAGATISGRPWVDELDPAAVESRSESPVEVIRASV